MIIKFLRKVRKRLKLLIRKALTSKRICRVLIYHRVIDLSDDPQQMAVSIKLFDKHLQYLKKNFQIISLQELVSDLKSRIVRKKSLVITFDDGYFDNYVNALPLLEKYEIPATIFVSSDYVNTDKLFWWDELEQIILRGKSIEDSLTLKINASECSWTEISENKLNVFNEVHKLLKSSSEEQRLIAMASLREQFDTNSIVTEYRALTKAELLRLSNSPLIEIGAHTATHCVLSNETRERQMHELVESKKALEQIIKKEIFSFSYPFGSENDISIFTPQFVESAGFNCAVANIQNFTDKHSELYKIPRILIRNWDIEMLKKELDELFLN